MLLARRQPLCARAADETGARCHAQVAHTGTSYARDRAESYKADREVIQVVGNRASNPRAQRFDKNKIYSVHEPEVECISKGKAGKKYEFGNKVSVALPAGADGWWARRVLR